MNTTLQVLDQLADELRKSDWLVQRSTNGDLVLPFFDCNKTTMHRFSVVFEGEDTFIDYFVNGERVSCVSCPIDLDLLVDWADQHLGRVR